MWMSPGQNQSWVSEFILLGFSSDPTTNRILFSAFLLLYLSSVLGNGLIITLVCLDMHLHTPMYFFLCILSLLDMSCVTTTMPQMLMHLLSRSQTISFAGCWLQMYIFDAVGLTECILFVVMAFDRYVAICYPLRYTVILSWGLCTQLSAGTWACGFFFSLIHTFFTMRLPYCGPNRVNHYFCEGPSVQNLSCLDTHVIEMVDLGISVFMVVAPLLLIVASYIRIAQAILKFKSMQARCKAFSTCASHLTMITFFYAPATYLYMRPNASYSSE
ncbi:olfactory receptor 2A12-like [Cervus canadensis]|uniref:olfactory receptor 2A12-like n=1 Tax=Cervus canadensis TaxID=1574408 RepID=UPI001C9E775F|nr:olfactory receptor 2A12-like [Cervus canadensis]